MSGLASRLLVALAAAIIVWLICVFFGGLLALMNVPIAAYVGSFIKTYAIVLAVIAFIVTFFRGGFSF